MSASFDEKVMESLAGEEPGWAAAQRRQAWKRFASLPPPTGREERWRFTDPGFLDLSGYEPGSRRDARVTFVPPRAWEALEPLLGESAGSAVLCDGVMRSGSLGRRAAEAGVILTSLEWAVVHLPGLVRGRLGSLVGPEDVFTSRSLALRRGGAFLYVPAGIRLEEPVRILSWASTGGLVLDPRTLVVVEDGASLVVDSLHLSDHLQSHTLVSPVVEVFAGRGAHVSWMTRQELGAGARYHAHERFRLDEDALLQSLEITLGADFSRSVREVRLAGERAGSEMLGLYAPRGDQRVEHWTVQHHEAARTRSDLLYKGIVSDEARALYYGTIRVDPGARGTDAYQANRNLKLSPGSRVDSNPQLEIGTNDVRCTHGSTVGNVGEEHLFYLMSRGIARDEAVRLVVSGFLGDLAGRTGTPGHAEEIRRAVSDRFGVRP